MYLSTAHSNGMIWYKPTLINKCISSIKGKQKYFSFGILFSPFTVKALWHPPRTTLVVAIYQSTFLPCRLAFIV